MDLNNFSFIGRLGQDPRMQYTSQGTPVANFSAAIQLAPEKTLWMPVTVWGKQAENVATYLSKGSQVAVSGRLTEDSWETDDGQKRTTIKTVASTVQFLGSPSGQGKHKSEQPADVDVGPVRQESSHVISDDDFPL